MERDMTQDFLKYINDFFHSLLSQYHLYLEIGNWAGKTYILEYRNEIIKIKFSMTYLELPEILIVSDIRNEVIDFTRINSKKSIVIQELLVQRDKRLQPMVTEFTNNFRDNSTHDLSDLKNDYNQIGFLEFMTFLKMNSIQLKMDFELCGHDLNKIFTIYKEHVINLKL